MIKKNHMRAKRLSRVIGILKFLIILFSNNYKILNE